MTSAPAGPAGESTSTVVIGSGFSGLAVATELSRHGIDAIVVDGLDFLCGAVPGRRTELTDPGTLSERGDILRLLRHYASRHHLDVRDSTRAVQLSRAAGASGRQPKWIIHTADGILLADNIVLTRCAQNQLRRILISLGIKIGRDVLSAMRALGLFWVGAGDLVAPTTREILHQAKVVSQAISTRNIPSALPALS
ncbi:NAD(P)-binding protein [Arthrobacter sp. H14-L1]|uniref:NAD(P)-binding protein n=1 Tax=Arthrobacter sp. H14-L1 TaxID=2996697 RepID=UPI00226FF40B|nr:NAD(P)-binding protein [Arthrobacter sp. H14-L1]MCY0904104.1 NAD(P)-binding protein [Arthrobacter sp. H14-L1]